MALRGPQRTKAGGMTARPTAISDGCGEEADATDEDEVLEQVKGGAESAAVPHLIGGGAMQSNIKRVAGPCLLPLAPHAGLGLMGQGSRGARPLATALGAGRDCRRSGAGWAACSGACSCDDRAML